MVTHCNCAGTATSFPGRYEVLEGGTDLTGAGTMEHLVLPLIAAGLGCCSLPA